MLVERMHERFAALVRAISDLEDRVGQAAVDSLHPLTLARTAIELDEIIRRIRLITVRLEAGTDSATEEYSRR